MGLPRRPIQQPAFGHASGATHITYRRPRRLTMRQASQSFLMEALTFMAAAGGTQWEGGRAWVQRSGGRRRQQRQTGRVLSDELGGFAATGRAVIKRSGASTRLQLTCGEGSACSGTLQALRGCCVLPHAFSKRASALLPARLDTDDHEQAAWAPCQGAVAAAPSTAVCSLIDRLLTDPKSVSPSQAHTTPSARRTRSLLPFAT